MSRIVGLKVDKIVKETPKVESKKEVKEQPKKEIKEEE